MATEAQILANQRNSRLSRGPTTERGKTVSSQNARKHGLRAAREQILRGEGMRYEERKRKWMSELDPRTDREEYLAHDQVLTSMMIDRVRAAHIEKVTTDIEEADEREEDDVDQLAERLYFNRAGSAATLGCLCHGRGKDLTSFSGKSVDADKPSVLVKAIASSARGCRWLLKEWMGLKERLEGSRFWQSIDRFQAIRLLGKQPVDAGKVRIVTEIFIAGHAIDSVRIDADHDMEQAGSLPFRDLLSDMTTPELTNVAAKVKKRWPDMVSTKDRERCREILVNLVDRELARLAKKLKAHERNTEKYGQKSVDRLGFGTGRDAELMHRYHLRYRSSFFTTIRTYDKMRARELRDRNDDVTRRPEIAWKGGERRAVAERKGGEPRAESGGKDDGGCGPDDDTRWALELDGADVLACGGLVPKRYFDEEMAAEGDFGLPIFDFGLRDNGGDGTGDGLILADEADAGLGGIGELGADVDGAAAAEWASPAEAVTSFVAADFPWGAHEIAAMTSCVTADGAWEVPSPQEVDGTARVSAAQIGCSDDEACPEAEGACENGGLDNDVTNEAKFAEDTIESQGALNRAFTADSGGFSALDKEESEANFERLAAVVTETENRGGEELVGDQRTLHRVGSASGAGAKKEGWKSKRERRRERTEMTEREIERRVRAVLEEPGSDAEAFKLIDDLREIQAQAFRKLMPNWPRGP